MNTIEELMKMNNYEIRIDATGTIFVFYNGKPTQYKYPKSSSSQKQTVIDRIILLTAFEGPRKDVKKYVGQCIAEHNFRNTNTELPCNKVDELIERQIKMEHRLDELTTLLKQPFWENLASNLKSFLGLKSVNPALIQCEISKAKQSKPKQVEEPHQNPANEAEAEIEIEESKEETQSKPNQVEETHQNPIPNKKHITTHHNTLNAIFDCKSLEEYKGIESNEERYGFVERYAAEKESDDECDLEEVWEMMMTSNYFKSQLRKFDSGKQPKIKPKTPSKPKVYLKELSQKKDALFVQLGICQRKCYFFQGMRDENRNLYLQETNEVVGSWKYWEVDEKDNDDVNVSQNDCIQMEQQELILF